MEIFEHELLFTSLSNSKSHKLHNKESSKFPHIKELINHVKNGFYSKVISSALSSNLVLNPYGSSISEKLYEIKADTYFNDLEKHVETFLMGNLDLNNYGDFNHFKVEEITWKERRMIVLIIGVSFLYVFLQANVTGPKVTEPTSPFRLIFEKNFETRQTQNQNHESQTQSHGSQTQNQTQNHESQILEINERQNQNNERQNQNNVRQNQNRVLNQTVFKDVFENWAMKSLMIDGSDFVSKIYLPQYLVFAHILLTQPEVNKSVLVNNQEDKKNKKNKKDQTNQDNQESQRNGKSQNNQTDGVNSSPSDSQSTDTSEEASQKLATSSLWAFRALVLHQRILSDRSMTLRSDLLTLTRGVFGSLAVPERLEGSTFGKCLSKRDIFVISSSICLEIGLMEHAYGYLDSAKKYFDKSAKINDFEFSITGMLGYRTVHQIDPKAQMVLVTNKEKNINKNNNDNNNNNNNNFYNDDEFLSENEFEMKEKMEKNKKMDKDDFKNFKTGQIENEKSDENESVQNLNSEKINGHFGKNFKPNSKNLMFSPDSDILITPKLVTDNNNNNNNNSNNNKNDANIINDKNNEDKNEKIDESNIINALNSIQQAIVLANAIDLRKNSPIDELVGWELAPYIEFIENQKYSREMIKFCCNLLRVRWEKSRSRTRERALSLMESLIDKITNENDDNVHRMQYAFNVWFPTISSLQKEYGHLLISNGLVGEAIQNFEKIELWDDLIDCYILLGKKTFAADLINKILKIKQNDPRLWCCLGDINLDFDCYKKAWEVSGKRYTRAQRSMARMTYNNGDYDASIKHWKIALDINPLYSDGWFSYGYAAIKANEFTIALHAFTRCVQLDFENGESWNNIAALNIQKKRNKEAFKALQEALKFKRDSWQMWENLTKIAIDIKNFNQAIIGMNKVLDLTKDKRVDLVSLEKLIEKIEKSFQMQSEKINVTENNLEEKEGGNFEEGEGEGEEEREVFENFSPLDLSSFVDFDLGNDKKVNNNLLIDKEDESKEKGNQDDEKIRNKKEEEEETIRIENLVSQVQKIIGRVVNNGEPEADIFFLQYRLFKSMDEKLMAKEAILKNVRALQGFQWSKDEKKFKIFSKSCLCLSQLQIENAKDFLEQKNFSNFKREISSSRLQLRNVLKQANDFSHLQEYQSLEKCLEEILLLEKLNLD